MMTLLILTACALAGEPTGDEQVLASTEAAAKQLGKSLKTAVVAAMKESGPPGALAMCAEQAQPMTAGVASSTGVAVGRSSLRLRNSKNAGPDWVQAWLTAQGERKVEGVTGIREIVDVEGMREARFLMPIGVEAPCLNCHGATVIPEVEAKLAEAYPEDKARGYAEGDLRGALWASQPVP